MGDPSDEKTEIGPLIRHAETDRIESWVNEAVESGAKLLSGGKRAGDAFYEATVFLIHLQRLKSVDQKSLALLSVFTHMNY